MYMPDNKGQEQPGKPVDENIVGQKPVELMALNREIAYAGKIGRRREEYCREQMRYMGVCHRKIGEDQSVYVKARGETISCQSGCSYCCQTVYVGASLQECEAIAYYLAHHEPLLLEFMNTYPKWREKVRQGGDRFHDCEQFFNDMLRMGNSPEKDRAFQQVLKRHNKQGIACPFLKGDLCTIYEVRPSNCAGFFVTHARDLCRPREYYEPKFNLTSINDVLYDTTFYYQTLAQPITLYMPVAVYRLLEEGYYFLSQFPGLEDIAAEALSDPEVQGIVRSLYERG